jgi:hypothetical protein
VMIAGTTTPEAVEPTIRDPENGTSSFMGLL